MKLKIIDLDRPYIGVDFTHTITIQYTLSHKGKIVFDKQIKSEGTATMNEMFIGVYRSNRANEYAVRNNIKAFLAELEKAELASK